MSLASTISGRSVRAALALILAAASTSCVDGDPTGAGRTASIGIAPSFQVLPSDFASGPIDEIRLVARDASTLEVVGSATESVDPTATEWPIDLGLDFGGASSLSIVVEVELLGDGVVEWSGRLGPLTVRLSFGGATAHEVPVYRGPLDNLDVESVTIVDPPTQMLVGGVAGLGATVQLLAGSDAEPNVYWVSLDPTVATVTAETDGALVLGVSPGTARIAVGAGPALDEIEIEVLPRVRSVEVGPLMASVDGLGVQIPYAATVTNGFGDPADEVVNWSSSDPSVATVDADGLVTTVGFGTVRIVASAAGVSGEGGLTVRGPDLVPSAFTVTPDGDGEVIDFVATAFEITVANEGTIVALASTVGIRVLDALLGTEAHPTLEFAIPPLNPGESYALFARPEGQGEPVELPSLLSFEAVADFQSVVAEEDESNNVAVSDDIGVLPGPPPGFDVQWLGITDGSWATASNWSTGQVPAPHQNVYIRQGPNRPTLSEARSVRDLAVDPLGTLEVDASAVLALNGDLLADGAILGAGRVQMQGSGVEVRGAVPALTVLGSVTGTGADMTITGDLTVIGTFTSSAGQTTVAGPVALGINGSLVVPGASALNATGVLTLQFASMMDVGGTVTAAGCANNGGIILGSGTQPCGPSPFTKLWLGGAVGAVNDWHHPDNWRPAGVPVSTDRVLMQLAVNAPVLTAAASVARLEIDDAMALDQDGFALAVSGDLRALGGGIFNGTVTLTTAGGVVEGSVDGLIVQGDHDVDGALFVGSDLVLDDGDLVVGANSVGVGGNLLVTGSAAHLVMQDAGGVVDIAGDATFTGGSHVDLLSAGTIFVGGDFTATASSNTSFAAQGTHGVVLDGTGAQVVSFSTPGTALQRFLDLEVVNFGGGVTFASDVVVMGALVVDPDATVDAADDVVSVGGSFAMSSISSLQELTVVGDLTAIDAVVDGDVRVSAAFSLPTDVTVNGNLFVESDLTLSGNRALVNGNFLTAGTAAQLIMTNAADTLDVFGNVTFTGGSQVGLLTNGFLRLTGDFTASGSTSAFAGTGSHTVVFVGTTTQLVNFSSPGLSQQRFQNMTVENFSGDVALASSAVVTGAFDADDVQLTRAVAGALLEVRGIALLSEVQFVGLPMELTSSSGGPSHLFSLVTFTQMDPVDIQLRVELPGAVNFPLLMSFMTFDTADPEAGGAHLWVERGSEGPDEDFVVLLEDPQPPGASAVVILGANTAVDWP